MLKLDEEVILNSLLKLREKLGTNKVTGSYEDFPVKYQICYKEILDRLEQKKFIKDFTDFQGENFTLTLQPSSLESFIKKRNGGNVPTNPSSENTKDQYLVEHNIEKRITAIEKIIEKRGGEDKEALKSLMEEVRELCENLQDNPTLQPRKTLIKRIIEINKAHPWVYSEVVKIFGVTMIQIMSGK